MDNDQLSQIIESKIASSIGYDGSTLSSDRAQAMDYYLGEPLGNEVDDRSQVVSTDVSDTIEQIMPELMRIFESGAPSVEFEPEGEEDVKAAELASKYVDFIWKRDNPSFLNTYTWLKDGLLQKTGVIKVYWNETEETVKKTIEGLSDDELTYVMQDESLEIVGHEEQVIQPEMLDEMLSIIPAVIAHTIQVETKETKGRIKVDPIPPDEFSINKGARSLEDASMTNHKCLYTISELREEGYDEEIITSLVAHDEESDYSEEAVARRQNDSDDLLADDDSDESAREVWVNETYLWVDFNGDGKTELRKIVTAGDNFEILDNEEVDFMPFCAWSPVLMPHRFTGRSVAELIMDIQQIKTTLLRQYLDNLYVGNNQRHVVNSENVNLSDLLNARPNGIVRTKGIPAQDVVPLPVQDLGQSILAGVSYFDNVKQDRTGVGDATAGMNPNVLANANTGVMAAFVEKSQATIELIARVFAEVGMKQAHKLILKLVVKYQDTERMIRFDDDWQAVNPAEWPTSMDVTVRVGLGTGNKDKKVANMEKILSAQKEGLALGITTRELIYNTVVDGVEAMGEMPHKYFQSPQPQQPQPPQPDPAQIMAQAEIQKKQMDMAHKEKELLHESYIKLQEQALKYGVAVEQMPVYQQLQAQLTAHQAPQQEQM